MNDEFEPFVKRPEVAFPSTFRSIGEPEQQIHRWGMELRDYFAAKAMQGMLAENGGGAAHNIELAKFAYEIADAMMKAREQ